MEFKTGDRVRCIDPGEFHSLELHRVYTVQEPRALGFIYVNSKPAQGGWNPNRFELVEAPMSNNIGEVVYYKGDPPPMPSYKSALTTLPIDSTERKNYPLFRGLLRYFPAALAGVSKTSKLGNDKHNPNEEMHHARGKSGDHGDCILRHLIDTEDLLAALNRNTSGATSEAVLNEVNQLTWRVLAFSQELHEKFGAPLAPGAKK